MFFREIIPIILWGFFFFIVIKGLVTWIREIQSTEITDRNSESNSELFVETDILGLSKPSTESLVSDKPGIKNPQLTFQVSVLLALIVIALFTLKINTPVPFDDKMEMSEEEKRIEFRKHGYFGYPTYTCGFDYFANYRPLEYRQAKPTKN